jgi:DNA-binding transcriptional ArsR family regulator
MVGFTQSRKFDRVKIIVAELPEVYNLETIEQMRAIADQLRQRIMQELLPEPRTVTQVAEVLGLAPAKVHYHVRELERVRLVKLVFTREKGGILEKYYQPVARNLFVDEELLRHTPPEEYIELANRLLGDIRTNFVNSLSRAVARAPEHDFMTLRLGHLWITPDEFTQLKQELAAIEQRYQQRRGVVDEREVSLVVVTNEPGPELEAAPATRTGPIRDPKQSTAGGVSKPHKTWAAGAFRWDADALETSLARGETLDITVLGVCTFDGNVSADLANRAISHFSLVGKLVAPPEVREVLKTKE